MALKDILVQLDPSTASERRLEVACQLARRHNAHLRGLCVVDLADIGAQLYVDDFGAARVVEQLRTQARTAAAGVEEHFRERMRTESFAHDWTFDERAALDVVTDYARLVDLSILGQSDPANPGVTSGTAIIEHVLFSSGRPVLMVPYAGTFGPIGTKVLIGWAPSREAARAVNDALPLIAADAAVTVLAVIPREDATDRQGLPTAPITVHLARHGLKVQGRTVVAGDFSAGDVLLNTAADESADLLVVGAYGHSRVRELVMGGVTRTLLEQATLPVLMAH